MMDISCYCKGNGIKKRQEILQRQGAGQIGRDVEPPIQDLKRQEKFQTALEEINKRYSPALKN